MHRRSARGERSLWRNAGPEFLLSVATGSRKDAYQLSEDSPINEKASGWWGRQKTIGGGCTGRGEDEGDDDEDEASWYHTCMSTPFFR